MSNIDEVSNRKSAVLNAIFQKAQSFDSVTRIIVEKNEAALLKELVHLIKLEYRYLHNLRTKQKPIRRYFDHALDITGKDHSSLGGGHMFFKDNSSWFIDKDSVDRLYDLILVYVKKRDKTFEQAMENVYEERRIVEKWRGSGFYALFRLLTFRKNDVLTNFREDLTTLLTSISKRYEDYEKQINESLEILEKIQAQLQVLELKGLEALKQEAIEEEKKASKEGVESVRKIRARVSGERDSLSRSLSSSRNAHRATQSFSNSFGRRFGGGGGGRFGGGGASGGF